MIFFFSSYKNNCWSIAQVNYNVRLWTQQLCDEWGKKPQEEQKFDAFHRAVSAAAFYQSGRLKYRINMLSSVSV
mgnify:CR=1 FL=1